MRKLLKQSYFFAIVVLISILSAAPLPAQQVNAGIEDGFPPYGSFHGSSFDEVLLQSGSLHVDIPLVSVKQRGGKTFTYRYIYDPPNYEIVFIPNPNPTRTNPGYYNVLPVPNDDTGWRVTGPFRYSSMHTTTNEACNPQIAYNHTDNYVLIDPDGTKHQFALRTEYPTGCLGQQLSGPALDGSGIFWSLQTGIITLKDGTQITPAWHDTNGNTGTSSADTLNRNLLNCSGSTCTILDPNGNPQTFQFAYNTFNIQSHLCGDIPPTISCHELTRTVSYPISLTLPNSKTYLFSYLNNSLGELTRIDLPTGAYLTYTSGWGETAQPTLSRYPTYMGHTKIATRTVNQGGTASTWTYSGSVAGAIADPIGNEQVHTLSGVCVNAICSPSKVETMVKYYQGLATTGTLLRTVQKDWTGDPNPSALVPATSLVDLRPIRETTTLDNGLVKKTETDYETFQFSFPWGPQGIASRLNPTERREFDYASGAPGPLVRKTHYSYLHTSNQTYVNLNIVDRPTSVITYDEAGNIKAQATNEYDNYTTGIQPSGAVQHSSSFNTSYLTRGNLTAANRWRNTDGAWLTTRNQYDDAGNLLSTSDPLAHTTQFDYTDSWSSFPGSTGANACAPSGGQGKAYPFKVTNSLNQVTTYTYYSCTGIHGSTTDPNSQTTTVTYDLLARPLVISYPDGGQTSSAYDDTNLITTTNRLQSTTPQSYIFSRKHYDHLGRVFEDEMCENGAGTCSPSIKTDYNYDSLDRLATATNPYRTISDSTYGITATNYDPLNRISKVIPPDGTGTTNNVATVYSGNCTTVTDQTGKTRKSCSDGLGRLTQVFEDPASLNYETDYTYDALDNLLTVNQKGNDPNSANWRARTFTYNSLSQLLTAANPESGAATYTYNSDGTLATKISPAPNQTGSATVTTTFTYDQVRRVTQKSFSDGTTPTVKYGYDAVAPSGCTLPTLTIHNGIGKRTGMCDAAGAEAWSYDITAGVGWKLTDARTTNSVTKSTIVQNNLAGSAASLTYPSGRIITYAFDAAARPLSAIDSTGPINYATAAAYAPTGALSSLTNGASLVSTLYFNNRLQPCRISAKSSGTAPANCTDAVNIGNALDFTYNFSVGTADNGNVTAITNNRDTTRSQSFLYDSLNRISTAKTTSTTGTKCWDEAFGYDPWGNLLTIGRITGYSCSNEELLNTLATPQNRISGDTYDTAGNLTLIPSFATYTYNAENQLTATAGVTYTYDGDGKRVQKSSGKLYWYGMGSDPLDETDLTGSTSNASFNEYIFFGGKRIARRDSTNAVNYYFADHLGTARIVANSSGTPVDDSDFYPFGGERVYLNSSPQNYKFTGKERDSESGNDHFAAREYSSTMGRWIRPDPLPWLDWQHGNKEEREQFEDFIANPQNFNMYSYVNNNPLNKTDPTGMKGCQAGDKKFETCTITIVYDPKTSNGTITVTGQNKGDKDPTVLLTGSVVVGGDGHVTPTGTFTATTWEKDHVSTKYGSWANTKWSDSWIGKNVFGPFQLHIGELEKQGIWIHGTLGPSWSPTTWGNTVVGSTSHGCIRLCNQDDIALHNLMPNPRGNQIIIKTTRQPTSDDDQ